MKFLSIRPSLLFCAFLLFTVGNANLTWGGTAKKIYEFTIDNFFSLYRTAHANGTLFMRGYDSNHSHELWKTDGTEAGTAMVKDINPNGSGLDAWHPVNVNNRIFFSATDFYHGFELWVTDGTEDGTSMVKDICIGRCHGFFRYDDSIALNDILIFAADDQDYDGDDAYGVELWRSDGTPEGTTLIKDINSRPNVGSRPKNFININGTVYFSADDFYHGRELWKTDGTEDGTVMVKDLNYSNPHWDSNPVGLTNVNGTLFFWAKGTECTTYQPCLYKSDGTEAGTVKVSDIGIAYQRPVAVAVGDILFFPSPRSSSQKGIELWKSDGTEQGTILVKDIAVTDPSYNLQEDSTPQDLINVNGKLFFTADDFYHGRELWTSDGTESGTIMVKDMAPGEDDGWIRDLVNMDGKLYFIAGLTESIWRSDGTEEGTEPLEMPPGKNADDLVVVDSSLFFLFHASGDAFTSLWKYTEESLDNNAPNEPVSPIPTQESSHVGTTTANLQFTGGDPDQGDTVTYDVYLTANDNTPDNLVCNDISATQCDVPFTLAYDTNYYWQVVATDNHGASTTGPVWQFTTESAPLNNNTPDLPSNPLPAQDEINVTVASTTDLEFTGGDPDQGDTVTYDVYLSANDNTPDNLVCNDISATQCDIPFSLAYDTNYYWRVVATDNHGASTTGPVWHFSTESAPSQVWTLNIFRSGSGTVISNPAGLSCGANCSHSFDDGTSVTLTATPSSGWRFSGWSAPCSGTGACTLDMTSHYDVNATFVKIPQSQSVFPWNMFLPAIIQGHR